MGALTHPSDGLLVFPLKEPRHVGIVELCGCTDLAFHAGGLPGMLPQHAGDHVSFGEPGDRLPSGATADYHLPSGLLVSPRHGGSQLLSPSKFRALVSGREHGFLAALLRSTLRLAEFPYSLAISWRNHRYDTGAGIHRVAVPVVSVGNLTLGGTGKTPMVEWVVRWLLQRGARVTVISRGYGAPDGTANDEAMELAQRLPDVPHLQEPDRVAAAGKAIATSGSQVLVLDDAFQHRRIARDLDLVLLDALEPFGFDHVFPRGTLREPATSLRRADMVILTRAGMLDPPSREAIRQRVAGLAPRADWAEVDFRPHSLRNASGIVEPIASLSGKTVAAFCGVGNPAGFRHTLRMCGCRVIAFREFADHYRYTRADMESLTPWADGLEIEAVLCTHKDLVKLGVDRVGRLPLWAVTIAPEFLAGQAALESRLARLAST